ncbi:MAG: hypothetical protein ACF8SC_07810, partial [Phycisphaerales bacterium JB037]
VLPCLLMIVDDIKRLSSAAWTGIYEPRPPLPSAGEVMALADAPDHGLGEYHDKSERVSPRP